jgi:putative membrane protein
MRDFVLRLIVTAVAIFITASLLPGIHLANDGLGTLLIVALIFGIINALIKPILTVLSCPLVLITLGLFMVVINGLMLMLTASLSGGRLVVDNIWWAILGGIIMGIVGMVLEGLLGLNGDDQARVEIRR